MERGEMTIPESIKAPQEGESSLQLRIAEAYHKDAGKGVARIGAAAMASLSLENGGVVEIKGKDKLYAIVWPGNPEDSEDLIRIDGNTRANLGVGIDSKVAVSRAEARQARKIVVAPTRPIRLMGGPAYLLRMLQGRAVVKGEMLRVEMINSSLNLAVVSTMPAGAVLVTPETIISITRETLEELALHVRDISYEDIGGLAREIREIREMIEVPLRHPELYQYDLDLADIAEVWRRGSVISSWLLDLAARALLESPGLATFAGRVSDSGEGRWTIMAAVDEAVPAPVLSAALYERFGSRGEADFADRMLSALRFEFGGHLEKGPAAKGGA